MEGIRVLIADTDHRARQHLRELLAKAGYLVVGEVADGRLAAQQSFNLRPDLVILDTNLSGRDGLQVARVLDEQRVSPVLLVTEDRSWRSLEQAKLAGVYACLLKPVGEAHLIPAAELAVGYFQRLLELERKNQELQEELQSRRLVEKAKELLMARQGCSEAQAFRFLRKLSMDRCTSLGRVAQQVVRDLRRPS